MTIITVTAIKQALADKGLVTTATYGKSFVTGEAVSVYRINVHDGHAAPRSFEDVSERACWLKVYEAIVKE